MGRSYYNEIDPAAVAILRQQIADGVIAPGDVDTRSIKDIGADDLRGYTQCHFFAGGGLWSVAARAAGWPDDRPLWTGSCPCQPFSAAGKGRGTDDPRHLWPDFHRLIRAGRPAVVMGEQVAGTAGYGWLDGVRADLAAEGYASRGVDIPACSVDAPHQRNRLYWIAVADALGGECDGRAVIAERGPQGRNALVWTDARGRQSAHGSVSVVDGYGSRLALGSLPDDGPGTLRHEGATALADDDLGGRGAGTAGDGLHADAVASRLYGQRPGAASGPQGGAESEAHERQRLRADDRQYADDRRNGSAWADADWIVCHDGKKRRAQPGLRLLVDGLPGRVDLWRVGGNAIVPVLAAEVICAFLESEQLEAAA